MSTTTDDLMINSEAQKNTVTIAGVTVAIIALSTVAAVPVVILVICLKKCHSRKVVRLLEHNGKSSNDSHMHNCTGRLIILIPHLVN